MKRIIVALTLALATVAAFVAWPIAMVRWELGWRRTRREVEQRREPYVEPEWVG
ncbi:MAG TPA: hypothetical protein VF158_10805 [Longimicrobiales bacterium]